MASAEELVFEKEIQMMMFGLGDSQFPLLTTASVIESVVRQQLTVLLLKADNISVLRDSTFIELQDILFILRKDKLKLKRLLQFVELKDTKMGMSRIIEEMDPFASLSLQNRHRSRKDNAVRYLSSIGIDDVSLENLEDQVKLDRLKRANEMALTLSNKSYLEFHKSRTCSFIGTELNLSKMMEWLKITCGDSIFKLKKDIHDILVYLAKEVVAELIDFALLVRQDSAAGDSLELSRAADPLTTNPHQPLGQKQNQMEGPMTHPITPEEIREVVRRFMSNLLFPIGSFSCNIHNPVHHRLLID